MFQSLLVALDGSEPAERALERACEMAGRYGASLDIVHVAQPLPGAMVSIGGGTVPLSPSLEETRKVGEMVVEAAARHAGETGVTTVRTAVLDGEPAAALLEHAQRQGCDLIVLGTRGLGSLRGLLMGSVSHKVAQHASCTVMLVR
jgi:nucleotide-binding universal stress UspA family protein